MPRRKRFDGIKVTDGNYELVLWTACAMEDTGAVALQREEYVRLYSDGAKKKTPLVISIYGSLLHSASYVYWYCY